MKTNIPANTTKFAKSLRALTATLAVLTITLAAFAHGGFDHVMGTVVKLADNVLTVKTAKGDVEVKLNEKTELTKGAAKAQVGDLAVGVRVVVDIPEGAKEKIAHSVKIGAAGPATHPPHQY